MKSQELKLKFAVLWLLQTVNYTAYILIGVFVNELWAFLAAGLVIWYAWKQPVIIGSGE